MADAARYGEERGEGGGGGRTACQVIHSDSVEAETQKMGLVVLTWSKDNGIPEHDVVGARSSRDATWGIALETLKVLHETATGGGRHCGWCVRGKVW